MMISIFERIENIVGKGENAGYQHFLLFHNVFEGFFHGVLQSWDCTQRFKQLFRKVVCESLTHYSQPSSVSFPYVKYILTCVFNLYDISSNSPSGGTKEIVLSFSNLDNLTH